MAHCAAGRAVRACLPGTLLCVRGWQEAQVPGRGHQVVGGRPCMQNGLATWGLASPEGRRAGERAAGKKTKYWGADICRLLDASSGEGYSQSLRPRAHLRGVSPMYTLRDPTRAPPPPRPGGAPPRPLLLPLQGRHGPHLPLQLPVPGRPDCNEPRGLHHHQHIPGDCGWAAAACGGAPLSKGGSDRPEGAAR